MTIAAEVEAEITRLPETDMKSGSETEPRIAISDEIVDQLLAGYKKPEDAALIDRFADRFAQHCHVIDIDADSWRQKSHQSPTKQSK